MAKKITRITDLTPNTRNANKGTVRGLAMLEDSLGRFGAGRSILADKDGNVIAGNKTLQAAVDAGIEIETVHTDGKRLVVVVRDDLAIDSVEGRALAVADNRVAQVGLEWDSEVLAQLQSEGVPIADFFDQDELLALIPPNEPAAVDPGAQVDKAEALQQKWQVKRGDLWQIGEHRLLCGDSTSADDVAKVMGGEKADAVVSDPSYGMKLNTVFPNSTGNNSKGIKASSGYSPVIGDDKDFDFLPFAQIFTDVKEQFWWGADYYRAQLPIGGSWIVWDKRASIEDVDYSSSEFELCWSKSAHHRIILRVAWFGAIGTEQQDPQSRMHPTQKPIQVIASIIERHCGDIIIDPFLGSGTTLVACEQTGRKGRGIEIEPKYCAVILERLSAMGLTPVLCNE